MTFNAHSALLWYYRRWDIYTVNIIAVYSNPNLVSSLFSLPNVHTLREGKNVYKSRLGLDVYTYFFTETIIKF